MTIDRRFELWAAARRAALFRGPPHHRAPGWGEGVRSSSGHSGNPGAAWEDPRAGAIRAEPGASGEATGGHPARRRRFDFRHGALDATAPTTAAPSANGRPPGPQPGNRSPTLRGAITPTTPREVTT